MTKVGFRFLGGVKTLLTNYSSAKVYARISFSNRYDVAMWVGGSDGASNTHKTSFLVMTTEPDNYTCAYGFNALGKVYTDVNYNCYLELPTYTIGTVLGIKGNITATVLNELPSGVTEITIP